MKNGALWVGPRPSLHRSSPCSCSLFVSGPGAFPPLSTSAATLSILDADPSSDPVPSSPGFQLRSACRASGPPATHPIPKPPATSTCQLSGPAGPQAHNGVPPIRSRGPTTQIRVPRATHPVRGPPAPIRSASPRIRSACHPSSPARSLFPGEDL